MRLLPMTDIAMDIEIMTLRHQLASCSGRSTVRVPNSHPACSEV
jgi:hypothetical protein